MAARTRASGVSASRFWVGALLLLAAAAFALGAGGASAQEPDPGQYCPEGFEWLPNSALGCVQRWDTLPEGAYLNDVNYALCPEGTFPYAEWRPTKGGVKVLNAGAFRFLDACYATEAEVQARESAELEDSLEPTTVAPTTTEATPPETTATGTSVTDTTDTTAAPTTTVPTKGTAAGRVLDEDRKEPTRRSQAAGATAIALLGWTAAAARAGLVRGRAGELVASADATTARVEREVSDAAERLERRTVEITERAGRRLTEAAERLERRSEQLQGVFRTAREAEAYLRDPRRVGDEAARQAAERLVRERDRILQRVQERIDRKGDELVRRVFGSATPYIDNPHATLRRLAEAMVEPRRLGRVLDAELQRNPQVARHLLLKAGLKPGVLALIDERRAARALGQLVRNPFRAIRAGVRDVAYNLTHPKVAVQRLGRGIRRALRF